MSVGRWLPWGQAVLTEVAAMLDPVFLHNLTQSRPIAELLAQLTRVYPEVAVEAMLPLLAARLVGADAATDEDEFPPEPELISA